MASFWRESFLAKRRREWLDSIAYAEYVIGSTAYKADIQQKLINGDKIEVFVVINHLSSGTTTIKSIRVYDTSGELAGERTESIVKSSTQGVLVKFEFPLREV